MIAYDLEQATATSTDGPVKNITTTDVGSWKSSSSSCPVTSAVILDGFQTYLGDAKEPGIVSFGKYDIYTGAITGPFAEGKEIKTSVPGCTPVGMYASTVRVSSGLQKFQACVCGLEIIYPTVSTAEQITLKQFVAGSQPEAGVDATGMFTMKIDPSIFTLDQKAYSQFIQYDPKCGSNKYNLYSDT